MRYCAVKDDLYRTLIRVKKATPENLFSPEYFACVDAIKEHDREGHLNGQPCPDAGY